MSPATALDEVRRLRTQLGTLVATLDEDALSAGEACTLVEELAALERLAVGGRTLAAKRVARSNSWRWEGDRSPAHWLARKAGIAVGHAITSLETAERLHDLPATEQALRAGELSAPQANEIASAAAVDPRAEAELLSVAASDSLAALQRRARQVRSAADGAELARYQAIHRTRYLRHWSEPDGAFRLDAKLTPDAGAAFLTALEPWRERVCSDARRAGSRDRYDAYAADALLAMGEAAGRAPDQERRSPHPRATVHVHVDHAALVRGRTTPGETCEVSGVGPIPVEVARQLLDDAVLKVLVDKGVEVTAVAHAGRTIPVHVRTALEARDRECCVPGCHVRRGLEIDHLRPFALGGATTLGNLARLCHWHHRQKTLFGWRLVGPPDRWRWLPPPSAPGDDGTAAGPAP